MKYTTKKLLILPLLGFLAAGCGTSSNLQTSETDDVYFSSSDKVTYVEPTLEEQEAADAEASGTDDASRDITDRVSDPESYAKNRRNSNTPYQYSYYDAPFGNPYYAYVDPFYSPGRYYSRAIMMDPWMDPFYDPFYGPSMARMAMYDPFWPRPGLSIGIGLGFGRYYNPWGYGGYGYGYNPYRFGGGYYGGGSYYDNYYGGGRVIANNVAYGRRNDRSSNTSGRNPNISRDGRGGIASPGGSRSENATALEPGYRNRSSRTSSGQPNGDGTIQSRRRQMGMPSGDQGISAPSQERRARISNPEGSQPERRQRTEYTPAPSRTSESRSYEPSRSNESSRSSSSSSGSSSGSSTGGGRRGRN